MFLLYKRDPGKKEVLLFDIVAKNRANGNVKESNWISIVWLGKMQSKGYVVVKVWIIQAFLLSSAHWKPEIVKSINLFVCFLAHSTLTDQLWKVLTSKQRFTTTSRVTESIKIFENFLKKSFKPFKNSDKIPKYPSPISRGPQVWGVPMYEESPCMKGPQVQGVPRYKGSSGTRGPQVWGVPKYKPQTSN